MNVTRSTMRVLIVDDDEQIQALMKMVLANVPIVTAASSLSACIRGRTGAKDSPNISTLAVVLTDESLRS